MSLSTDVSLKSRNSFSVNTITPILYRPDSIEKLTTLANNLDSPFYVLGEGSNTLFVEGNAPIIIQPAFTGLTLKEHDDYYQLHVAAAENWHRLVCYCVERNIAGLENLALIPGSVGAAPVQNIGAYGVEFADVCHSVSWFCFNTKQVREISKDECQFSYRNSIFKSKLKGQGVITGVTINLAKVNKAKLDYAGLDTLPDNATPNEIMTKVIEIRNAKLPDPNLLPNAGSFFKNPVVSNDCFNQLIKLYPSMPSYPQADNHVKLAAGWLIEHAGLKGYRQGNVGVHDKQALVLVNYGSTEGKDVKELAQYVQAKVMDKFAIWLEPEVRMIGQLGEISL